MNYLFATTAFMLTTFVVGTSCGQMTPIRPAPQKQESQLVPGAQAPFPVITFPTEPASGTSSAPAPQHDAKKPDETKPQHDVKKQTRETHKHSYKPRDRQSVGAGDSAADFLNRQELSRITGVPGY